ncbi:MAG: hypothetical protein Fur0042_24070 [Cyanophyceae cyanobacterium]
MVSSGLGREVGDPLPVLDQRLGRLVAARLGIWRSLPTWLLGLVLAAIAWRRGPERAIVWGERWAIARPQDAQLAARLASLWDRVNCPIPARYGWLRAAGEQLGRRMGDRFALTAADLADAPRWRPGRLAMPPDLLAALAELGQENSVDWRLAGRHWAAAGRWLLATAALERAIAVTPNDPIPQEYLGWLYQERRDWAAAAVCYGRAIALNPRRQYAYKPLSFLPAIAPEQLEATLAAALPLMNDPSFPLVRRFVEAAELRLGQMDQTIARNQADLRTLLQQDRPQFFATWDDRAPRSPQFVILGAQKAGTSSLHKYLHQHPQVLPTPIKEIQYFFPLFDAFETWPAADPARSREWYFSHFPPIPPGSGWVVGEASPEYLPHPQVPERFATTLPDARAIILLRDPVARFISHYHHWVRASREVRSLGQVIRDELATVAAYGDLATYLTREWDSYLARGIYGPQIDRWIRAMGRDRLLLLQTAALDRQPQTCLDQVCDFLDLPRHGFDCEKRYNVGSYGGSAGGSDGGPERDRAADPALIEQLRDFYAAHTRLDFPLS